MPLKALFQTICLILPCLILVLGTMACSALAGASAAPQYKYFRIGAATDAVTAPQAGFALMGGGKDLDEAFRWMCMRAGGGDFLVLRATGNDDYNPYIQPLCRLNSVATLILPNREAANDPFVVETIAHAEAIFIAGGDQANYIRYWKDTPVQAGINAAIRRGVPIGGTSAGLAVMGEWAYSAEGDKPDDSNLDAKTALINPMGSRVTLVHGFLDISQLKGIITDSHFAKRDRMGRLLAFIARIQASGETPHIRGIGVEQGVAVLVEPDGQAKVIGKGAAYLVTPVAPTPALSAGKPLTNAAYSVVEIPAGGSFDLARWKSDAIPYTLTVENGALYSESGKVY